jgi:hypothetical protein
MESTVKCEILVENRIGNEFKGRSPEIFLVITGLRPYLDGAIVWFFTNISHLTVLASAQ